MSRSLQFAMWLTVLTPVMLPSSGASARAAEPLQQLSRDVRKILSANCYACHGHDVESREGELRLDVRDAAIAERDGNSAIVPGNSAQSEVYRRIISTDPDKLMPPADSGHKLTADQIDLIRRWIDEDAEYSEHWSFVKPARPVLPSVQNRTWPRNEIDAFVLARLEAAGLQPNPEADRHALVRRLSLDLTGIPPTPEEANTFAGDRSLNAYEALVDRLLESERFGEHWARMWLDLARYADTKGYEKDQPRQIWRYRDWVIRAFNADMPFDQFTVEQLGGDLLKEPTTDQLTATAFHRNTMTNDEGGTDNEEFRIAAVKDRVDTTIQVWMGLTMGCAKCHSHKYDPLTQREYYRFLAFFNQTEDADRSDDAPRVSTPTPGQRTRMDDLSAQLAEKEHEFREVTPEFTSAQQAWKQRSSAQEKLWAPLRPKSARSEGQAVLTVNDDASIQVSGAIPQKDVYTLVGASPLERVTAIRIEVLGDAPTSKKGKRPKKDEPRFVISELTITADKPDGGSKAITLAGARADVSQPKWNVAGAVDGKSDSGWGVASETDEPHVAVFELSEPLEIGADSKLTVSISQQFGKQRLVGQFRVSLSSVAPNTLAPQLKSIAQLAAIPDDQLGDVQQTQLDDAFRLIHPPSAVLNAQIAELKRQVTELKQTIVSTPVMRELAKDRRRETHVHVRGNFLKKGDLVEAGFPVAFGSMSEVAPHNRLGVARWLVHVDNPLTSRVAVNRFWARFFGVGLVETEEDFGTQGIAPSHPQLLDWLAVEFQDRLGWSVKRLLKTIVMSSTYRQSSRIKAEAHDVDPNNRLIGRGSRFRLPAETVRDQALSAAGLLSGKVGGPSVMPSQPPGIWRTTYSKLKWKTSSGEDRYRRALYTFWRRTSPYPAMTTFDAASREVCVIRRVRTNTPLQALVIMNDPVYVEAAGALARRILVESGPGVRSRVIRGFRLVLVRPPDVDEAERLERMYLTALGEFQGDSDAAKELLKSASVDVPDGIEPAELAAWTIVGNVLLNLDETMMRD